MQRILTKLIFFLSFFWKKNLTHNCYKTSKQKTILIKITREKNMSIFSKKKHQRNFHQKKNFEKYKNYKQLIYQSIKNYDAYRIVLILNLHSFMKFSSTIKLQNFVLNFTQNNQNFLIEQNIENDKNLILKLFKQRKNNERKKQRNINKNKFANDFNKRKKTTKISIQTKTIIKINSTKIEKKIEKTIKNSNSIILIENCHDYLLAEVNWSELIDLTSIIKTDFLFVFTQTFYNFIAINITFNNDNIIKFCLRHSTVNKSINVFLTDAIIIIVQIVNNSLFEVSVSRTIL